MSKKRSYLAQSGLGFQYAATPLAAITGLLEVHRRDWKGREASISVYDTTDAPEGASVFTDETTGLKKWRNKETNETGTVPFLFALLTHEDAEYQTETYPNVEHLRIHPEYFRKTRDAIWPFVVRREIQGDPATYEIERFINHSSAVAFLYEGNPQLNAQALANGEYFVEDMRPEKKFDVLADVLRQED